MPPTRLSQLQAYASPWLKATDLQGRAATVTIETVTVEEIRQQSGQKEARIVISFAGKAKRMICNKTQALSLADLAKTEVFSEWKGLAIILEPAKTPQGRDTIHIRPLRKPTAAAGGITHGGELPDDDGDGDQAGAMPPRKAKGDNPFEDMPPEYAG